MADTPAGTAKGLLSKAYNGFSTVVTVGGVLLLPFFGAAASTYMATQGAAATVGGLLTSFHSTLWTNAATGATGIGPGISNIFTGWAGLGKGLLATGKAAISAEGSLAETLSSPLELAFAG